MEFVRLGNSGLKVSQVTFGSALTIGTEHGDQRAADALIDRAWQLGVRSFDVANSYGNGAAEEMVARSLRRYPRSEYVISTKAFHPVGESVYHRGLSRKHLLWALGESLGRMKLDYVDVFYAHRFDPEVPVEEVARTFNRIIADGRALYWGTSEWPAEALRECRDACERLGLEPPVVEQPIYSYAVRKIELNGTYEFCRGNGVGIMGFSPLCQGFLTGKYRGGVPAGSRIAKGGEIGYGKTGNFYRQYGAQIDFFLDVCERHGLNPATTALQWCIRKGVYPVLGASRPEQLDDSIAGIGEPPCDEAFAELDSMPPAL